MSSPVWQMKESISSPLPSVAMNSFTRRIIVSLGLMWPPMLPTSALMMERVIFMSADLLMRAGPVCVDHGRLAHRLRVSPSDRLLPRAGRATLLAGANPETGPAPLQRLALSPPIVRRAGQEGRNRGGSLGGVERHHRDVGAAAVRLQSRQRVLGDDLDADLHRGAKGGVDRREQFEDVTELHRDAEHQRVHG